MSSPTINSLTSFSGSDLVVTFANQPVGELQEITWGIQREVTPIFTFGSPNARSFSRNKRAIAGTLGFAMYDHDSLVTAIQHVWDKVAPPAMFTAAGNIAVRNSEDFSSVLNNIRWNIKAGEAIENSFGKSDKTGGFGFSGASPIKPNKQEGSNGAPSQFDSEYSYFVEKYGKGDDIYVPAGFTPIRGENILYADTLPPFDATLTFANEFGQTAFQKIYDITIANDSSGMTTDSQVLERKNTYVARMISPLIRGVYTREEGGILKGVSPTAN